MIFYIISFISGSLLATGIILIRNPFYILSERTFKLLNLILDSEIEENTKQKKLIHEFKSVSYSLIRFILILISFLILSGIPFLIYERLVDNIDGLAFRSFAFWGTFSLGTVLPFLLYSFFGEKKDYSELSILLHKFTLNNYNISQGLYKIEKALYKSKLKELDEKFVIVTGLARAGTTALTTILYSSKKFHALTYANMPFIICPNIWMIFYHPKKDALKERSHKDSVLFGYNSVEALEEFFWKMNTRDRYIKKKILSINRIDNALYQEYIKYQSLLKQGKKDTTIYLAKNNNFILHYEGIRKFNKKFITILMFRDPINHAYSLLMQHQRYVKLQNEDEFILEYMNWLAHHEFGKNQKYFHFNSTIDDTDFSKDDINYWLLIWINYYTYIINLPHDKMLLMIDYNDFLQSPQVVLSHINQITGIEFNTNDIKSFENKRAYSGNVDQNLLKTSQDIYESLLSLKMKIAEN